ncbi:MFS transporter [Streptomyces albofaciens]|uniref:MFS transporter n=1 Tax=Streptomyces albofaciens TaxID=66866 RepID=UPI00244E1BB3|nr:MFS transporter [Streptomyces albofaciens]
MTRKRGTFPLGGLLALATAGFLTMLTETVPAGLLGDVGRGLDVSEAQAGQLLTVYAAGSVIAAIPLTSLTRGLPRRPLLVATVAVVALVNILTAVSDSYALTMATRLVAGMGAGVQWAMIAGYAMRLVDEPVKGRALAVSMAGVPTALAFGVPVGTYAGDLLGWRYTFAVMGGLALLVALWIHTTVRPFPGEEAATRMPLRRVFLLPGLVAILASALLFEVGHMNLYTYVDPYLRRAGLGDAVSPVLLAFGVAAMAGLFAAGAFIDRNLRAVVIGTLGLFAACMALFGLLGTEAWPVVVVMFGWGSALGLAPTMFQAASARAAGPAADVAQSMIVTVLNAGMSIGSVTGGVALGFGGVAVLPWISCAVFVLAAAIAVGARRNAFPAPVTARAAQPETERENVA